MYDTEYYFGGGIYRAPVGTAPYGTPVRMIDLGVTKVSKDEFESFLEEISPRYTHETYSLLKHNCNNFSNEVAQFLVKTTIPQYILDLPNEVSSSPLAPLMSTLSILFFAREKYQIYASMHTYLRKKPQKMINWGTPCYSFIWTVCTRAYK